MGRFMAMREAAGRFPAVVGCSLLLTGLFLLMAGASSAWELYARPAMVVGLGLPLFFLLARVGESRSLAPPRPLLLTLAGVAALAGHFLLLPPEPGQGDAIRYALLLAGVILAGLAPTAPRGGGDRSFWSWWFSLCSAAVVAAVSAVVAFGGVAAALGGVDYLFGLTIPGETYFRLWLACWSLVAVWVFLARVPPPGEMEGDAPYPKVVRGFGSILLLPLVTVYLLILYAYAAKIVLAGAWPQGGVAGFTIGFSAAGILTWVLLLPENERRGVLLFRRLLFPLLLPLSTLLLLAVARRISEYGVTESRYLGIVLGVWLAGISLFALLRRGEGVARAVPLSLGVLALAASFGPWGALAVSERSQVGRLEELLAKKDDPVAMSKILRYLQDRHGLRMTARLFGSVPESPEAAMAMVNLPYSPWGVPEPEAVSRTFTTGTEALPVKGFAWMREISLWNPASGDCDCVEEGDRCQNAFTVEGTPWIAEVDWERSLLKVKRGGETAAEFDLGTLAAALVKEFPAPPGQAEEEHTIIPRSRLMLEAPGGLRISISGLDTEEGEGQVTIMRLSGAVLIP